MKNPSQVNKLLAFVLPIRSVHRFPFIYHMAFSLARSYHRTIVASNLRVNAIYIKKQFCLRTVRVLKSAFKMSVRLRPGITLGTVISRHYTTYGSVSISQHLYNITIIGISHVSDWFYCHLIAFFSSAA